MEHPFYGARRMCEWLRVYHGYTVNYKKVRRLMRLMGLQAVYPKPRTSIPDKEHKIYPYLLRNLEITCPNQVWARDITYIPMAKGFMYLVAIMDWYSRKVLSWQLCNTLDARFCIEALESALQAYPAPEIFNTDQGSQFTCTAFTETLKQHNIKISMDGRGRYLDNIFVERLWWSLKYECIYLHCFETGTQVRQAINKWMVFYNGKRLHQSLDYTTPDKIYFLDFPNVGVTIANNTTWRKGCHALDNSHELPTTPQSQQKQQLKSK